AANDLTVNSQPTNSTVYWYTQSIGGDSTIALSPSTDSAKTYTYYVAAQDNTTGCVSPRVTQTVTVSAPPGGRIVSPANLTEIYPATSITLVSTGELPHTVEWSTTT